MQKGRFISLFANILISREQLKSSHGYTGKGTAVYPNNDKYVGDFKEGVSDSNRLLSILKPLDLTFVSFFIRFEAARENTLTLLRAQKMEGISHIRAPGKTIRSAESVNRHTRMSVSITATGRRVNVTEKA